MHDIVKLDHTGQDKDQDHDQKAPRPRPKTKLDMTAKFGRLTQNKGHFAVRGHSRSPIFVPIERSLGQISVAESVRASCHDWSTILKKKLSKSAFSEVVRHFEHQFQVDGDVARNRSMDRWIGTTLPLEVFTQRNFEADFFREKLNFTGTNSDIAFCATLWGT